MDPVADVHAGAVERGAGSVDHVGDLARDEFLHGLVCAVVVQQLPLACGPKERPKRASQSEPAFMEVCGLDGLNGVLSVNTSGSSTSRSSMHFVCGDLVEAFVVLPGGLDECRCP